MKKLKKLNKFKQKMICLNLMVFTWLLYKNKKVKNLSMLWNKYYLLKRLAKFYTFKLDQEMMHAHFETLCTVPLYSIPLTIMLRTNTHLILFLCCIQIQGTGLPSRQVLAFINKSVSRSRSFTMHSLVA